MVKCRIGEEKQTVLQLMRKMIAYQHEEEPLQIRSVVAPEHVKGYIYVEAFKQSLNKRAWEKASKHYNGGLQSGVPCMKAAKDVHKALLKKGFVT